MKRPIRLMIADDHALFRHGLQSLLKLHPEVVVVGEVDKAGEVRAALRRTPCDVLLLDLQMERNALPDIASLAKLVKVVVVTASERAEDALSAVRLGARAVVFKRFAIENLLDAIEAAAQDHVWMPPAVQARLAGALGTPREGLLSSREREVMRLVAAGLRNAEVARELAISEPTVKTHIGNIFGKLGIRDRVELALYAIRTGAIT